MDRLASIIEDGRLWCDAEVIGRTPPGTSIGMGKIKQRRLGLPLDSHPELNVGDCVPFYFCPRSIMLYLLWRGNHPELEYRGGQQPIIHLETDLHTVVNWAEENGQRWAFTLSNAGAFYFEDRNNLAQLGEINWDAVQATNWQGCQDGKQAEFLLENNFPWHLVERIGVINANVYTDVMHALTGATHTPVVEVKRDWYY